MAQNRFLFGALDGDLSEFGEFSVLAGNVEDERFPITDTINEQDLLRGARQPYYFDPESSSDSESETEYVYDREFLYFQYVAGTVREGVELTDEGADRDTTFKSRDVMDFVLFSDGRFLCQSTRNLSAYEAIRLVICFTTKNESPDFKISDEGTITPEILNKFYQGEFYDPSMEHSISELRVSGPANESEDNDIDDPQDQMAADILDVCKEVTFNAFEENDASASPAISSFTSQGEIKIVNSDPDSGNNRTLSENGWLKFSYPDSMGGEPRGKLICNRCIPILDAVTSV